MCGIRRYAECETLIMEHKKGILKLSPGMGADETLEAKLQVCCLVYLHVVPFCMDLSSIRAAVRIKVH